MKPQILFAHGAGAGSSHPWMQGWKERLSQLGRVTTFDYPYMREGKRAPNRLPRLIEAHREALAEATREGGGPVVLAGKSMGSRVGCHLTLEDALPCPVSALVCFGYPLVGAGKQRKLRDEVLVALRVPVLFIQGTRDKLCPLDELEAVRKRMSAPNALHIVEAGDHSSIVTKTQLRRDDESQADVDARTALAIRAFFEEHL